MHRLLKKSAIWGCPCWVQELSAIWDHYLQTSPELQIQQMTAQQNRICASALRAFIVKWDLLFLDLFVCNVLLFINGSTSETRVLKWVGHEMTKRLYDAVVMQEILCQLFFPLHHALQCRVLVRLGDINLSGRICFTSSDAAQVWAGGPWKKCSLQRASRD